MYLFKNKDEIPFAGNCYITLQISYKIHTSSSMERLFLSELFEMRRSQTGHFLELGGKMRHTAVMHQVSDFSEVKFIVNEQFFYPLNFVSNKEFFNRNALHF